MTVLREVDFAGRNPGPYSNDRVGANPTFLEDWHIAPTCSSGGNSSGTCGNASRGHRLNIVQDPIDPSAGTVLRVTYLAGEIGGSNTAMVFEAPFNLPHGYANEGLWLQYRLMFDKDFQFTRGGKLPGLGSNDVPTGCVPLPDPRYPGFTARRMWHYHDANLAPEGPFVLTSYLYHQQKVESCGDYFMMCESGDGHTNPPQGPVNPACSAPVFLQAGEWYVLTQFVRFNNFSPTGESLRDGVVVEFVGSASAGGKPLPAREVLGLTQLELRTRPDVVMDKIAMQTFFGGSTSNWAPSKDEYAYFDNFRVSTDMPPGIHLTVEQKSRLGI